METFLTPNLCGEKPTDAVSFIYSVMHVKTKHVFFFFLPLKPSVNLKKKCRVVNFSVWTQVRKRTNTTLK